MLGALKQRFELLFGSQVEDGVQDRAHAIQLATATLLAEVARADGVLDARELTELGSVLRARFSLDEEETQLILEAGLRDAEESVSLQSFTRILHESLSAEEKAGIIGMLWAVAAADGALDKYEDAAIAKIGELLYVPRSEVLRLKHDVGL